MSSSRRIRILTSALLVLSVSLITAPTLAREVAPAPEGGGPGETVFAADNIASLGSRTVVPPTVFPAKEDGSDMRTLALASSTVGLATQLRGDDLGGDDVIILQELGSTDVSMDIASNGDIYVAVGIEPDGYEYHIKVFRSQDGGASFALWGLLDATNDDDYKEPCLDVVEGAVSACFVAFTFWHYPNSSEIRMVQSPLDTPNAVWGPQVTVMANPGVSYRTAQFDTDVESYDTFYIYVVAEGRDDTGVDIWFARSTNRAASFESAYRIAELLYDDREYRFPDISYGYGGFLHAAWDFRSRDGSFDSAVRVRRAASFADHGLSDWGSSTSVTSTSDGYDDESPLIQAGRASNDGVVVYRRFIDNWVVGTKAHRTTDAGATWSGAASIPEGPAYGGDLKEHPENGNWYILGLKDEDPALYTAHVSDLTSWSPPQFFNDIDYTPGMWRHPDIAFNPAKGNRIAVAWTTYVTGSGHKGLFDAEWFSDAGYPNMEPGFPLGLWAAPVSPPALAEIDGGGDLEIVFGDALNQIQVIRSDGSSPPGWPVDVGVPLSDGPVAIGDLNGDGVPTIVVGGTDGKAYAFDPSGHLLPGWPSAITPPGHDCYVSIGALGGTEPRTVVCAANHYVTFRNQSGNAPPGAVGWTISASDEFRAPVAIGDIDDDGVAEIVAGIGGKVVAVPMFVTSLEFTTTLPSALSDAVTLGDLDLDGDLEILCPAANGVLYALDHTGAPLGGNFPFSTGASYPLTSAALAQCLGTTAPEIAFGEQRWTVHMLSFDGLEVAGYPVHTGYGWNLWGAPILGRVDGSSSDLLVGARDKNCWAWNNLGALIGGWPEDAGGFVQQSPAMADIDMDGSVEVVFVSDTQLLVIDINQPEATANRTWPMYGHDPQRTGCSDCPEHLPPASTPDEEIHGSVSAVRLEQPWPNPARGDLAFEFAIPSRAVASLDILDLTGRRICTIHREETEPGLKIIHWPAAGRGGVPLANGQYLARLTVEGPGIRETRIRKFTLLR